MIEMRWEPVTTDRWLRCSSEYVFAGDELRVGQRIRISVARDPVHTTLSPPVHRFAQTRPATVSLPCGQTEP
jgi:hypothetical protein